METKSAGKPAFVMAALTSSTDALAMKAGSCGFSQMPSYIAVTSAEPTLYFTNAGAGSAVFWAKAGTMRRPLSPSADARPVDTTKSRRDKFSIAPSR